ncbi:6894_t:CDS:1, partial [Entrophospora sp. SA101]
YRQQQPDLTISYQKESRKLICDLEELIKDFSEEVRTSAGQLLENYKIDFPFVSGVVMRLGGSPAF